MDVKEEWKVIPGFSLYEVSNMGNVRSKDRTIVSGNSHYIKRGRILKGHDNGVGYLRVQLKQDGKVGRHYIHRLVAKAFVPNPDSKPCVNHIDNNPTNNKSENLEWCTMQENTDWMAKQGRNKRTDEWIANLHETQSLSYRPVTGENIVTGDVLYFEKLNGVKEKGFDPSCVCWCCKGIRNTHKGYIWKYAEEWMISADGKKNKKRADG